MRDLVRQLSIDQFENEGRRVDPESSAKHDKTPFFERASMDPGNVHKVRPWKLRHELAAVRCGWARLPWDAAPGVAAA